MSATLPTLLALLFYSAGTIYQLAVFRGHINQKLTVATSLGLCALAAHVIILHTLVITPTGADFGFFRAMTLVAATLSALIIIWSITKPVHNLKLFVYPVAIVTVLTTLLAPGEESIFQSQNIGLLWHIFFSILAYSILLLAAFQALLLYAQNHQLRSKLTGRLVSALPPLQTMESMLFEMIAIGLALLTMAILLGAIYVDDLLAQHLAHKTLLSIISWLIFAGLLIGKLRWGWRGITAAKLTIWGCVVLMLGFLGSKLVLEIIRSSI